MYCRDFNEIIERVQKNEKIKTVAVVCAHDEHTLEAIFKVKKEGLIIPVYIGIKEEIKINAKKLGESITDLEIYDVQTPEEAAELGVKLINEKKADFLMKGKLETGELLKAVVNKDKGLKKGEVMSHMAIQKIPAYHKMLVTTDGGMLPYPTLMQKKCIIENAVNALIAMGYDKPKVGILAAVEKPNINMPETLEAQKLKEMNQRGEIKNCIIEGPISLDLALVKERAIVKGYTSEVAGDADILVVPNIHAGNILGKTLVEMAGARMAGLILGAKCPIVLTSRGSSAEEKYLSLVLAAATSN